jgi:hypothetical protein
MSEQQPLGKVLRLLDLTVFAGLSALILYTVSKHEPWADEAQSWLIARDLPWTRMVFSELRYEGHPPLWYSILWPLNHLFHLPYVCLGYVGAAFAITGLAVLIFLAPFPRILRYLIGSSFFFVYQYAVVARSYLLVPLLGFLAAYFYRQGQRRILAFGLTLALLIQVSTHSAFLAVCMACFTAWQIASGWKNFSPDEQRRTIAAAAIVALSIVIFLVVVFPPHDTVGVAEAQSLPLQIHLLKTMSCLFGAFSNSIYVSAGFLLIACLWFLLNRGLLLMLPSVLGMAAVYGFLRGGQHHVGLVLVAFIVCVWMLWPDAEIFSTFSNDRRGVHLAFMVAFAMLIGWQVTWSYVAIRNDWAGNYSGARDAAMFLKSVNAEQQGCSAFFFYPVGVQPYFDHNIFENYGGPNASAFFHHSLGFARKVTVLTPAKLGSRYVLLAVNDRSEQSRLRQTAFMEQFGYRLAFYSEGSEFFENTLGEPQVYFVFERVNP